MSGPQPLFQLGVLVATPAALEAMTLAGDDVTAYLVKHLALDPGDLDAHDIVANQRAVKDGNLTFAKGTKLGDDYRKKLDKLPDFLKAAYIQGSWETTQGRYFNRYDQAEVKMDRYMCERLVHHQIWHQKWIAIDWGYNDFCVVTWFSTLTILDEEGGERDVTVQYREMVEFQVGEADLAELIANKCVYIDASGMDRAIETAQIVTDVLGLEPTQDMRLRPWDVGELSGKDKDEYQDVLEYHIDHPTEPLPGGESLHEFGDRTQEAIDFYLDAARKDGVTLLVFHTSNVIQLENICKGEGADGRPESKDSVLPGGIVRVTEKKGKLNAAPVLKEDGEAEYGS